MARTTVTARVPARLPRRLTSALLAMGVMAAPVAAASTATAVVHPHASCAEITAADPGAVDGTYAITVLGQSLDVWCADMATTPVEYLTLTGTNLSTYAGWGTSGSTSYDRVRLQLPTAAGEPFSVVRSDSRFATVSGGGAAFAGAGSCSWQRGTFDVDLRGTPFALDAGELAVYGWLASGPITQVGPQQLSGWVEGDCGSIGPLDPTPSANPWENTHEDLVPLVWTGAVAPVVTGPTDVTVASGDDAVFTTSATGDAVVTVQWQASTDGTTWTDVVGATTGTLTLPDVTYADGGLQVRAVHTNTEGSVPSAPATLTVLATAPVFTDDPTDEAVLVGEDATFTVAADGDPAPTLQWQLSEDGGTVWVDVPGATGTDLTLAELTLDEDGLLVRAVATNAGGAVVSAEALVTVTAVAPTITTAPTSTSVAAGDDATFSVAVAGTPTPEVQWQIQTPDGLMWADIAGATGTTLVLADVTAAQDGTIYRAWVSNAGGVAASDPVTLTVLSPAVVVPGAPAPAAPVAAAAAALPVTGGSPAPMLALALALLAAGATAVAGSRRTRPTA